MRAVVGPAMRPLNCATRSPHSTTDPMPSRTLAQPNRRCAYLSYLDSVKYLDPQSLRTDVYHEASRAAGGGVGAVGRRERALPRDALP